MRWAIIEKAIKEGCKLDIWASAGGCAVVQLWRDKKCVGYGSTAGMYEAIRHASEDYEAGGRDPKDVYGDGKLYRSYMTGSSKCADELERWCILKGHKFNAERIGESDIIITMVGFYEQVPNPKNLNRIKKIGRASTFVEALLNAWLALPEPATAREEAA